MDTNTSSLWYHFNAVIHAVDEPSDSAPISSREITVEIAGGTIIALDFGERPPRGAFSVSFEQAAKRMESLSRMFFEPDGSFFWTGRLDETDWQVEGVIYDRLDRLAYVETKGHCPAQKWDELLACFAASGDPIVFQLTRYGVYVSDEEFRRYAQLAGE